MANVLRSQQALDRALSQFRVRRIPVPRGGWLKAIRTALGMTQSDLANLMGLNQSSIHQLENSEANKTIKLETLETAADALGCDLVYAIVPRRSLEDRYRREAKRIVLHRVNKAENNMALEKQNVKVKKKDIESMVERLIASGSVKWDIDEK